MELFIFICGFTDGHWQTPVKHHSLFLLTIQELWTVLRFTCAMSLRSSSILSLIAMGICVYVYHRQRPDTQYSIFTTFTRE